MPGPSVSTLAYQFAKMTCSESTLDFVSVNVRIKSKFVLYSHLCFRPRGNERQTKISATMPRIHRFSTSTGRGPVTVL